MTKAKKEKVRLTDRKVESLKAAPKGEREQVMDTMVPGFGVRVTDTGVRTFIFQARFPGSKNPTRREIGKYPGMSLEAARERAGEWYKLVKQGVDPQRHEEETKVHLFGDVAEVWIKDVLLKQRAGEDIERDFRRHFVTTWKDRPIKAITDVDVLAVINAKKQKFPGAAKQLLDTIKRFFSWAVFERVYGVSFSPCSTINSRAMFGKRKKRGRTLNDDELFALWRVATKRIRYPVGPAYQLLILTGLRCQEAVDASRTEIDRRQGAWVIPKERMKAREDEAVPHAVPLTADIIATLDSAPRFNGGPYLFSYTNGKSPFWMGGKIKRNIDKAMLLTLKAMARKRGDDPRAVELPHWVTHDIRRTVRSRLSRLRVPSEHAEAVLAHVRPGIEGVYDVYDYFDEKKEALEKWAAELRRIVEPSPSNVIPLAQAVAA